MTWKKLQRLRGVGLLSISVALAGAAGLTACSGGQILPPPLGDGGLGGGGGGPGATSTGSEGTGGAVTPSDGPNEAVNPNTHDVGNAAAGKDVFRFETFGNEGFWTDAAKLPQGITAAKLTPVQALQAGLSVDIEALDAATQKAIADEIAAMGTKGPLLNSFATTVALLNANAILGVVVKDTNGDSKLDVAGGDKVGVTCALCHSITDKSAFDLPNGGSIGKRVDGPAVHTIHIGGIFAMAANTRAFFPMAQLKGADGKSIGRAPSDKGLTKTSTEAEFDAYFGNADYYPPGMFDDTVDGFGNPMHNTPMFRGDLGAPWGSAGELSKLDQFANTVYTVLLDPTDLLTPGGKAFLHKAAGAAGDQLALDYAAVLKDTGVAGYPFLKSSTTGMPGDPDTLIGIRVDSKKLLDMNGYLNSLRSPKGAAVDAASSARGRELFRGAGKCTTCHNVDQSRFVPSMIIPTKTIFPGDDPVVLAMRDAPLSPVEDTPGNTFDDKMIVINASLRGLIRGSAMPLLMDLDRKPVFLHDNSVPTLDNLLDPVRGEKAPHPFYAASEADRKDLVEFLRGLDDTSK
ncbi:MAG: hypothetical protein ABJE95_32270 [Byssovorax sp.]